MNSHQHEHVTSPILSENDAQNKADEKKSAISYEL